MRHIELRPFMLAAAIAVGATVVSTVPAMLRAQDAPHQDQRPGDNHDQKPDDHHDDHAAPRHDDRKPDDVVAGYRRDHPGAHARCHDGFFTRTADRSRACSKHGGIDVWIDVP